MYLAAMQAVVESGGIESPPLRLIRLPMSHNLLAHGLLHF